MPNRKRINPTSNKVKNLHPRSRKVIHVARQVAHDQRTKKQKDHQKAKSQLVVAVISWFRDRLLKFDSENPGTDKQRAISLAELRRFAAEYVLRGESKANDAAEPVNASQNAFIKRSKVDMKQQFQLARAENERKELTANGLSVPDLTRGATCELVRSWTDDVNAVQRIAFTRVHVTDLAEFESRGTQKASTSSTTKVRSTAQILSSTSRKRTRDDEEIIAKVETDSDSEVEICIKRSRPSCD